MLCSAALLVLCDQSLISASVTLFVKTTVDCFIWSTKSCKCLRVYVLTRSRLSANKWLVQDYKTLLFCLKIKQTVRCKVHPKDSSWSHQGWTLSCNGSFVLPLCPSPTHILDSLGNTSSINHLHINLCVRICFWTTTKTISIYFITYGWQGNSHLKALTNHCIRKRSRNKE